MFLSWEGLPCDQLFDRTGHFDEHFSATLLTENYTIRVVSHPPNRRNNPAVASLMAAARR